MQVAPVTLRVDKQSATPVRRLFGEGDDSSSEARWRPLLGTPRRALPWPWRQAASRRRLPGLPGCACSWDVAAGSKLCSGAGISWLAVSASARDADTACWQPGAAAGGGVARRGRSLLCAVCAPCERCFLAVSRPGMRVICLTCSAYSG